MKNNSLLAFTLPVAFACLLPTPAAAQTNAHYHQPLNSLPLVSQTKRRNEEGSPLTFAEANMYQLPIDNSQANIPWQPLSFSQANMYSPHPTHWRPYTTSQTNLTFYQGQRTGNRYWIPAASVEVGVTELPEFTAPHVFQPAAQTLTAACVT